MVSQLILDGEHLTMEQVVHVAYAEPGQPLVVLSAQARTKVERAAQAVQTMLSEGRVAYGITTGFGAFKDRVIPLDQVEKLQRNILVSHAVGVGEPFDRATTRAIMLIRANTLARGFSGIRLRTLQLLLDMLNQGIHPVIPSKGSLGASGDLAPLAHMSLPLIGEGTVEYGGELMAAREAFQRAGLEPLTLAAKEGLALTNGTAVMCALGVLETVRAERISRFANIAGCLSLEACARSLVKSNALPVCALCSKAANSSAPVRPLTCRTLTPSAACRKFTARRAMPSPIAVGCLKSS